VGTASILPRGIGAVCGRLCGMRSGTKRRSDAGQPRMPSCRCGGRHGKRQRIGERRFRPPQDGMGARRACHGCGPGPGRGPAGWRLRRVVVGMARSLHAQCACRALCSGLVVEGPAKKYGRPDGALRPGWRGAFPRRDRMRDLCTLDGGDPRVDKHASVGIHGRWALRPASFRRSAKACSQSIGRPGAVQRPGSPSRIRRHPASVHDASCAPAVGGLVSPILRWHGTVGGGRAHSTGRVRHVDGRTGGRLPESTLQARTHLRGGNAARGMRIGATGGSAAASDRCHAVGHVPLGAWPGHRKFRDAEQRVDPPECGSPTSRYRERRPIDAAEHGHHGGNCAHVERGDGTASFRLTAHDSGKWLPRPFDPGCDHVYARSQICSRHARIALLHRCGRDREDLPSTRAAAIRVIHWDLRGERRTWRRAPMFRPRTPMAAD